jgi:hypothetical protein
MGLADVQVVAGGFASCPRKSGCCCADVPAFLDVLLSSITVTPVERLSLGSDPALTHLSVASRGPCRAAANLSDQSKSLSVTTQ